MAKGEKCSFCGRGENEVRLLMPGRDGCICVADIENQNFARSAGTKSWRMQSSVPSVEAGL